MSLIADALKRAQEQRAQGKPGKDDDDRARRMLKGAATLRVDADTDRGVPKSLAVAGTVLAAALITFAGVVWLAPRAEGRGGAEVAVGSSATGQGEAPGPVSGPERGQPSVGSAEDEEGAEREGAETVVGPEAAAAVDAGASRTRVGGQGASTGTSTGTGETAETAGETPRFTLRLQGRDAPRPMDASELFGRALGAQRAGDYMAAASYYRRAIEQNPGDAQLHNNLGTVYRRLSMPGEALAAFRQATSVDPSYAPAWSNLGIMLDGLGRQEEAIDAFREALRRDPSNNGARVNLANKYIGMGLVDDAVPLLRDVLSDAPALPEAHYAMARAREAKGETDEAIRHYRVFLDLADGRFPALEARVSRHLAELEGGGE